jgi:hypothetical protein
MLRAFGQLLYITDVQFQRPTIQRKHKILPVLEIVGASEAPHRHLRRKRRYGSRELIVLHRWTAFDRSHHIEPRPVFVRSCSSKICLSFTFYTTMTYGSHRVPETVTKSALIWDTDAAFLPCLQSRATDRLTHKRSQSTTHRWLNGQPAVFIPIIVLFTGVTYRKVLGITRPRSYLSQHYVTKRKPDYVHRL